MSALDGFNPVEFLVGRQISDRRPLTAGDFHRGVKNSEIIIEDVEGFGDRRTIRNNRRESQVIRSETLIMREQINYNREFARLNGLNPKSVGDRDTDLVDTPAEMFIKSVARATVDPTEANKDAVMAMAARLPRNASGEYMLRGQYNTGIDGVGLRGTFGAADNFSSPEKAVASVSSRIARKFNNAPALTLDQLRDDDHTPGPGAANSKGATGAVEQPRELAEGDAKLMKTSNTTTPPAAATPTAPAPSASNAGTNASSEEKDEKETKKGTAKNYGAGVGMPPINAEQVKAIQEAMGADALPKFGADGKWGAETQTAFLNKAQAAGVKPSEIDFTNPENEATKKFTAYLAQQKTKEVAKEAPAEEKKAEAPTPPAADEAKKIEASNAAPQLTEKQLADKAIIETAAISFDKLVVMTNDRATGSKQFAETMNTAFDGQKTVEVPEGGMKFKVGAYDVNLPKGEYTPAQVADAITTRIGDAGLKATVEAAMDTTAPTAATPAPQQNASPAPGVANDNKFIDAVYNAPVNAAPPAPTKAVAQASDFFAQSLPAFAPIENINIVSQPSALGADMGFGALTQGVKLGGGVTGGKSESLTDVGSQSVQKSGAKFQDEQLAVGARSKA